MKFCPFVGGKCVGTECEFCAMVEIDRYGRRFFDCAIMEFIVQHTSTIDNRKAGERE